MVDVKRDVGSGVRAEQERRALSQPPRVAAGPPVAPEPAAVATTRERPVARDDGADGRRERLAVGLATAVAMGDTFARNGCSVKWLAEESLRAADALIAEIDRAKGTT